jgi:hypothetical protein
VYYGRSRFWQEVREMGWRNAFSWMVLVIPILSGWLGCGGADQMNTERSRAQLACDPQSSYCELGSGEFFVRLCQSAEEDLYDCVWDDDVFWCMPQPGTAQSNFHRACCELGDFPTMCHEGRTMLCERLEELIDLICPENDFDTCLNDLTDEQVGFLPQCCEAHEVSPPFCTLAE